MKSLKTILGIALSIGGFGTAATVAGVSMSAQEDKVQIAEAAVSKTVTRIYIEDQVDSNTTLLAIESISFASGYSHTTWRDFLTSYLGTRSSYTTTSGSTQPSTKGWSYMSNSEQEKYLLCPSGSTNFTMVFPDWVTAISYKAVGNNFWNWFDVNGSAVGLHSDWGIGKKVNSFIYNSGGWKMNAELDNTAQTNTWGDVTVTVKGMLGSKQIESKDFTVSKYYLVSKVVSYSSDVATASGFYTDSGCGTAHNSLLTGAATVYTKLTSKTEARLAGTMNGWNKDDTTYLMTAAENNQYYIDVQLAQDTEFKVVFNGSDWLGWSQVDTTSSVVGKYIVEGSNPDSTGARIKVKTAGKYEIYFKRNEGSNRIWIQQDSTAAATTWAQAFLDSTDSICSSGTGGTSANHLTALQDIWSTQNANFHALTSGAQGIIKTRGGNATTQDAYDRYMHIMGRYASQGLTAFDDWAVSGSNVITPIKNNSNSAVIIVVLTGVVGLVATGAFFLLRKKKEN